VYVGNELKKDKELLEIAENVFSKRKAYDWNQALMDFGSLICQSKKPQCASCPLQKQCKAYPEILAIDPKQKKTSANKKRIPFRDTDRFIRGKILDALREGTQPSVQEMCSSLERFSEERMAQVFAGLVQDGLIILRKNRACFPE
jgi:A/G-specific adenine glycosylase